MQHITDRSDQPIAINLEGASSTNQNAHQIATAILDDIIADIPTRAASSLNDRAAIGVPQDVLIKQISGYLAQESCVLDYVSVIQQINDLDPLHRLTKKYLKEQTFYNFATVRSINILQELVKRNHPESAVDLGIEYEAGTVNRVDLDVTFDYEKRDKDRKIAFGLYQKGFQLGCKRALERLGLAHCSGMGTNINVEEGKRYLRLAEQEQAGDINSMLGFCYKEGVYGHKKNVAKAFACYMNAHKKGTGDQEGFHFCYDAMLIGNGTRKDVQGAKEFIEQAHAAGNKFATERLGMEYFQGNELSGIFQDTRKGIQYLEQALKMGNGEAALFLYGVFYDGVGGVKVDVDRAAGYLKSSQAMTGYETCSEDGVAQCWVHHNLKVLKFSMNVRAKEALSIALKRWIDLYDIAPVSAFESGAALLEEGFMKEAHQLYNRGLMGCPNEESKKTWGVKACSRYDMAVARFRDERKIVVAKLDSLQSKTTASYVRFMSSINHLLDLHSMPQIIKRVRFKTDHIGSAENTQLEELKTRLTQELTKAIDLDQDITASLQKIRGIPASSEKSFNEFKTKIQYYKDRPFSLDSDAEKKLDKYEGSLTMILTMAKSCSQEKKIDELVKKYEEEWIAQSTQIVQESKGKELDELVRSWNDKIQAQAEIKTALLQDNVSSLRENISSKQQEIQKINQLLEEYRKRATQLQTSSNQDSIQQFNDQNQLALKTLEPATSPSNGPDYKEMSEKLQTELRALQAELKETRAQLETYERDAKNTQSRLINKHEQEIESLENKLKAEVEKSQRLAQQLEPYLKSEREQQTTTSIPVLVERVNHRIAELLERGVSRVRGFDLQTLPRTITGDYVIKVYKDLGFTYRPPGDHHNFDRGQGVNHIKITATMHDPSREVDEPAVVQELLNTLLSDLRLK